jgi:uncharacterized protein with HEPN domain
MPARDLDYLGNMLDNSRKAVDKISGLRRDDYGRDENLRLALAHLLQIIGEAARRVSSETQEQHPEIPWSNIIGMRHKIVHDYLEVDDDIVWDVITADLPGLITILEKIVPVE